MLELNDAVVMLALAIVIDLLLGEPPAGIHPVVWMGRWIHWWERRAPSAPALHAMGAGAGVVAGGVLLFGGGAAVWLAVLDAMPRLVYLLGGAWLLKTSFAFRALRRAGGAVAAPLRAGDLATARRQLSWHLVSRDTSQLDGRLTAAAAVESVAENFGDGFVAPLFYFALFGVPGALAYRFVNTADAMLGYRDARREYFGKPAARLDDVLNALPARAAALLILGGARWAGHDARNGWRVMRRDHARTASPNAGWPMSAMAGVLDLTLEKVGHYVLGDGRGAADADAIDRSAAIVARAATLYGLILSAALVLHW